MLKNGTLCLTGNGAGEDGGLAVRRANHENALGDATTESLELLRDPSGRR